MMSEERPEQRDVEFWQNLKTVLDVFDTDNLQKMTAKRVMNQAAFINQALDAINPDKLHQEFGIAKSTFEQYVTEMADNLAFNETTTFSKHYADLVKLLSGAKDLKQKMDVSAVKALQQRVNDGLDSAQSELSHSAHTDTEDDLSSSQSASDAGSDWVEVDNVTHQNADSTDDSLQSAPIFKNPELQFWSDIEYIANHALNAGTKTQFEHKEDILQALDRSRDRLIGDDRVNKDHFDQQMIKLYQADTAEKFSGVLSDNIVLSLLQEQFHQDSERQGSFTDEQELIDYAQQHLVQLMNQSKSVVFEAEPPAAKPKSSKIPTAFQKAANQPKQDQADIIRQKTEIPYLEKEERRWAAKLVSPSLTDSAKEQKIDKLIDAVRSDLQTRPQKDSNAPVTAYAGVKNALGKMNIKQEKNLRNLVAAITATDRAKQNEASFDNQAERTQTRTSGR